MSAEGVAVKYFDIEGNELNIGDEITSVKGDRIGRPKFGTIYAFDMWSVYPRARIKDTSHGKSTSTILIKNALLLSKAGE